MSAKRKPRLVEAAPTRQVKLDLACGQSPRDGFEGVDLYGDVAKHKVDLLKFPWPWANDSVDEINCSHFVEHIPARMVEDRDVAFATAANVATARAFLGQDMFFAFFDEAWRILKPDGWMHVVVPSARSNRGFQDPTHRRFIVAETFMYLWADWRKANKLDHYRVRCNFAGDVNPTIPAEIGLRAPEVQAEMIQTRWNTTFDWIAKLKALK